MVSTFAATLIMALLVHVPLPLMTRSSHIAVPFTSFPARTEVISLVVRPVSRVNAIFPIAEFMDFCNLVPAEFGREFPMPHLYPATAIRGCTVPAAPPENEVTAGEVKHVVGYADSHAKAQLGRVKKFGWL